MKIAFFGVKDWEKEYFSENIKGHELIFFEDNFKEEYCGDYDIISVFIYCNITKEMLDKLPNLKLIATRSTGFDHIDLEEVKKRGITVTNVPSYGENTVAEHTFALILNLARNVHKSYMRTINDDFSIEGLEGFDLKGKTLGVIGAGHIGMHVIKMAKGFGMNVLAFDMHHNEFLSEVLGFEYADLDTVLGSSDIISVHAPHNDHTHHMINKESIDKMKEGALLINTSRGGLVDTNALMEALDNGKIGGAGLDVIEGEELIKEEKELLHKDSEPENYKTVMRDHMIFKRENVVFTPHNGFNSREAKKRIIDTTTKNINSFLQDGKMDKVV
ncbi:MAG: NAD(P)-dependent oxidoreductase [Nanobdellota archaeon]